MKITTSLLLVLVTLCAVTRGREAANFAEVRAEYEQALERIAGAEEKKLAQLKEKYTQALDKGIVHYMRKGDLKSTLALRDERERFGVEGSIPPPPEDQKPANGDRQGADAAKGAQSVPWKYVDEGVIRTLKRCREHWQRINSFANRQRLELDQYYAEKLAPLERGLTRQGRLEEALAVSKEKERIAGKIAELKQALAAQSGEEPDPQDPFDRADPLEGLARVPEELRKDLIAYYNFDKAGSVVEDVAGHEYGGRARLPLTLEPSPWGMAARFDGEGDEVEVIRGRLAEALDGAEGVGFALWVRAEAIRDLAATVSSIVFLQYNHANKVGMKLILSRNETVFGGVFSKGGGWQDVRGPGLQVKEWQHVAGSVDFRNQTITLFINGVKVARSKLEEAPRHYKDFGHQRYPDLLGGNAAAKGFDFHGLLDEVMVFRKALSKTDAAELARRGAP